MKRTDECHKGQHFAEILAVGETHLFGSQGGGDGAGSHARAGGRADLAGVKVQLGMGARSSMPGEKKRSKLPCVWGRKVGATTPRT
jgi:hypothetical protein